MKILIGTTNPSKVERFKKLLGRNHVEFCTLSDLGIMAEPEERGRTPEENAVIKAEFYGQFFDLVICNDSGLYFETLPLEDERQPGLDIRSPGGCGRLDDEEMIAYYIELIRSLGGKILAYYLDGIAVYNHGKIFSYMEDREARKESAFYMIDRVADRRHPGWPLDSLSVDRRTGAYFVDDGNNGFDMEEEDEADITYQKRLICFLEDALDMHEIGRNSV